MAVFQQRSIKLINANDSIIPSFTAQTVQMNTYRLCLLYFIVLESYRRQNNFKQNLKFVFFTNHDENFRTSF